MTKKFRRSAFPLLIVSLLLLEGEFPGTAAASPDSNARLLESLGPAEESADLTRFLEKTEQAAAIAIGHGPRHLWVYFNPDCSYCHRLWLSLKGEPGLTVYWIPVGFSLKPESLARSSAILGAPDPARALARDEKDFDDVRERGGLVLSGPVDIDSQNRVTRNTMLLWSETGKIETPTLLFRETGGRIQKVIGLPENISGLIRTISVRNK